MAKEDVLATWLAAHHGVVTRQWLREHLFTEGQVRGLRESGRLFEFHRGVYVATSAPRTQLQRMVALIAHSDGAISHASAGQLWGFRKLSRHCDIHLSVLKGARRRTDGNALNDVVLHSTSELPPADVVRRSDGIVYTSAARTVFDLSSMIPADHLESIIEQGLAKGLFTRTKLLATQTRLARPGRNGTVRFNAVLAQRPVTQRPVDSDYELRLVKALEQGGLPPIQRQMPLELAGGHLVHPDLAEPSRKFIIEVDHPAWHSSYEQSRYDRWRDRQYRLLGWHPERVSDIDIDQDLATTVADLIAIYQALPSVTA
jgi:very-short-patch-repair endonuclease